MSEKKNADRPVVLVTGATGFTGSTAVDYLLQAGYPVLATDLPNANFKAARRHKRFMEAHPEKYTDVTLDIEPSDITDPVSLKKLFKKWNVRYLMHPAALFDHSAPIEALWKVNVEGTRNLMDAATSYCKELSGISVWSTALVYGRQSGSKAITETSGANPSNYYAESKMEQENAVLEYCKGGAPAVILRTASVYGPRSEYSFAKAFSPLAWSVFLPVMSIPGNGEALSSYVHVDDVVGAAMHLVYALGHQDISGEIYNVADDTPCTAEEIIIEAARRLRVSQPKVHMPRAVFRLMSAVTPYGYKIPFYDIEREEIPYMFQDSVYDNARLKETGYSLKYPETMIGLDATLDWYARNNKLDSIWYLTHPRWRSFWKSIPLEQRCYADYDIFARAVRSN